MLPLLLAVSLVAQVHALDQRVGVRRADPPVILRERAPLQQISRVHHDHLAWIPPAQGVHRGCHPREPAPVGSVRQVVPRGGVAVHVGGGDEHEMGTVWNLGDETDGQEEGKHWPKYIHSLRRHHSWPPA